MECEELIPAEACLMLEQVLFQQRRMMADGIRHRLKDHALSGQFRSERRLVDAMPVDVYD